MANPHKGEINLNVGNAVYTLVFNANVLCSIEKELGKGIVAIYRELFDMDGMSMTTARAALYSALRKHHPKVTLEDAGELIVDNGGLAKILPILGEGMRLAFPNPEENAADETATDGNPTPPGPSNGTGSAISING